MGDRDLEEAAKIGLCGKKGVCIRELCCYEFYQTIVTSDNI